MKVTHTTLFKRFLLSLVVVGFVDLLLLLIAASKGTPTFSDIIKVNLVATAVLLIRFGIGYFWKLKCPKCHKAFGNDTDTEEAGFPVFKCPKCGTQWLL
jgi:hypothetical protein